MSEALVAVRREALTASGRRWWQRPVTTGVWQWRLLLVWVATVSLLAVGVSVWGVGQVAAVGVWPEVVVAAVGMAGTALLPTPLLRDRGRHVGLITAALMGAVLAYSVHPAALASVMVLVAAGYAVRGWRVSRQTLSATASHLLMYSLYLSGTLLFVVLLFWDPKRGPEDLLLTPVPPSWGALVAVVMVVFAVAQVVFTHSSRWLVTIPVVILGGHMLPRLPLEVAGAYPYAVGDQYVATAIGMLTATAIYVAGYRLLGLETSSNRRGRVWVMITEATILLHGFIAPALLVRVLLVPVLPHLVVVGIVMVTFWVTLVGVIVVMRAGQHRRAFTAYRRFLADTQTPVGGSTQASDDPLRPVVEAALQHLAGGCDVTHAVVVTSPTLLRAGRVYVAAGMTPYEPVTAPGIAVTAAVEHDVAVFRAHPAVRSIVLRDATATVMGEVLVASSGLPLSYQVAGSVEGMVSLLAAEMAAVDQRQTRSLPVTWTGVQSYVTDNLMSEALLRQVAAEWSHDTDTGHGVCVAHLRVTPPGVRVHGGVVAVSAVVGSVVLTHLGARPTLVARDDDHGYLVAIPQRFPGDGVTRVGEVYQQVVTAVADRFTVGVDTARSWVTVATTRTPRLTPSTADAAIDTVKRRSGERAGEAGRDGRGHGITVPTADVLVPLA